MVRSLALRQEVRVWPNQGSTCLAQAIVRLMHRNPQTALAQSKHPYSIFDSGCSHSTAKRQWQFRKFTTYSHTINSKIKPNLSLLYATFSVSALEPSTAGENLGHLLFPVNGYPQTRFIFFHWFPFAIFFIRLIWNWNSRYISFSKKSLMAAPPILSLALPSETGRVLSIQSHTVQVWDLRLVGFRESWKEK